MACYALARGAAGARGRDNGNSPASPSGHVRRHGPPSRTVTPVEKPLPSPGQGRAAATKQVESECEDDHRFAVEETLLIFDWDDTLLPSTWVQRQGLKLDRDFPISHEQQKELCEVAKLASETLKVAKTLGTVVLVTNAERGWIELSCQRFLPSLYPLLEGIRLVSARTEYERPDVTSPCEWKLRAFGAEIRRVYGPDNDSQKRRNILSLGDSIHEREAVLQTTANMSNCRTKSLKFIERPSIDQLCRQHTLMAGNLKRIAHLDNNLDLCIKIT